MNSKASTDRGFGQISLPSSFLFKPLCGDSNKETDQSKQTKKNPSISLSEFLNRKLDRNSIPSKTVQSKQNPFSSIGASEGTLNKNVGGIKRRAVEIDQPLLDVTVFKQLKCPRQEIENHDESGSCCGGGEGGHGGSAKPNVEDLRNRTNPFRVSSKGGDERDTTSKYLVVLGDDPKPKQQWTKEIRNKKPKPFFNHYANGSGWWDCNMAGVDNDEVGCNEAWEGVGSTTLGGLEWH